MTRWFFPLAALLSTAPLAAQRPTGSAMLRGQVTDSLGVPIPSATVLLLGTWRSATTDAQGVFRFKDVQPRNYSVLVRAQFGGPGPFRFEVELRADGVWTRQHRGEPTYPWAEVREVRDTGDGIEIRLRAGLIVARNRGFTTAAAREEFLQEARTRAVDARPEVVAAGRAV